MLAGQLEQVSVVARLLAAQRLLVSHILAGVALIFQVCLSGASNVGVQARFWRRKAGESAVSPVPKVLLTIAKPLLSLLS